MATVAYSYIRFSHPDQEKGDSLRRQTEAAQEWCLRNKLVLDESTTLRDLGKSAYTGAHRKNPDRHALAAFLKLVEGGKIIRGSFLIIENLDRLSREDARPALRLWMDILDAGINIVQLKPETIFRHENTDMFDVMRAIMELGRGHGESAVKSMRNRAAWDAKRTLARKGVMITCAAPAWLEVQAGSLKPVAKCSKTIKDIFSLAANGFGITAILKKLVADGVPSFGTSGEWTRSYISAMLKDRRVVGELQPRHRDGTLGGEPIPDYYPPIVSQEEWLMARAAIDGRLRKGVRIGKRVSLFAGLIRDAHDGGSYIEVSVSQNDGGSRVLINSNSRLGRIRCYSFPMASFEPAVLSLLAEIDPREITGNGEASDATMELAGELAKVEAKIGELEAELVNGDVAALARVLREQEARKRELSDQLIAARQKSLHPLSESWGETQSLLAALENAPDRDEARIRLRAALTRIIDAIRLLVVPRRSRRLAAVQIRFAGGARRDYLIGSWRAFKPKPAGWKAMSFSLKSGAKNGGKVMPSDFTNEKHVKDVQKHLETVDLASLKLFPPYEIKVRIKTIDHAAGTIRVLTADIQLQTFKVNDKTEFRDRDGNLLPQKLSDPKVQAEEFCVILPTLDGTALQWLNLTPPPKLTATGRR